MKIHSPGSIFKGHQDAIKAVCVTPDCKYIVSGGRDKTIRIWDINSAKCIYIQKENTKNITSIAVTPDSRYYLSGGDNGVIKMRNIETGELCIEFQKVYSEVTTIVVTNDGKYALSGLDNGRIYRWDLQTGKNVMIYEKHPADIGYSGIIRSSNREIAYNNFITNLEYAYTYNSDKFTFYGHADRINTLSIFSSDTYFVTGSDDNTIRLWDLNSGQCLWILGGYHWESIASIYSLNITPNRRYIISKSGKIDIWKVGWIKYKFPPMIRFFLWCFDRSRPIRTFHDTAYSINCIMIDSDGKRVIVSSGQQGTLYLLKLRNGKCTHILEGHKKKVNVLVGSNNKHVIAGSIDGVIQLWNLKHIL